MARISDEKVVTATGKGWDHWFSVLDEFDCRSKGHKDSAQHLLDVHGVPMWWSQTVTIEYEVSRGIREPSQRSDSKFGLSVQRTCSASVEDCWAAFTTAEGLNGWFNSGVQIDLQVGGEYTGDGGDKCVYHRIERHALIRFTWENPKHTLGSVVEVEFEPKQDRTTVRVSHTKIANKDETDDLKKAWSGIMDDFKSFVER